MSAFGRIMLGISAAALCGSPAHADMVFTLSSAPVIAPTSLGFSNSTAAGTLTVGSPGPMYNFLDQWTFTLAQSADVGGFVGSFNFTDAQGQVLQGIDHLQIRLVGPSPGSGAVVGWQSVAQYSGAQTLFSVLSPSSFAPGMYSLHVRGQLVGSSSAYAGTLQAASPVPLPPSLPALAAGLVTFAAVARRRYRASLRG